MHYRFALFWFAQLSISLNIFFIVITIEYWIFIFVIEFKWNANWNDEKDAILNDLLLKKRNKIMFSSTFYDD